MIKIFNIMMSRDLGGIQQAYLDYNMALLNQSYLITNITSVNANINKFLQPNYTLPNFTSWCLISKIFLYILVRRHKPNIIICHGDRAINFACGLVKRKYTKIVGVMHNYRYKALKKCDFIIALSNDLYNVLVKNNVQKERIFLLPNMLNYSRKYQPKDYHHPVIIGSFGRFVPEKGFIYLIRAMKLLKHLHQNVKLVLGGSGAEDQNLKNLVQELHLQNDIEFVGWVSDKDKFFDQIDIFCLPSVSESFGIILLEAMSRSKPIVATDSGGPQEIIRHQQDGLVARKCVPQDLADKLSILINDKNYADSMTQSAYNRLQNRYNIKIVEKQLAQIVNNISQ